MTLKNNNRCLLSSIGSMPPAEAEARYYASMEKLCIAAWLKPNSLRRTWGGSTIPRQQASATRVHLDADSCANLWK